MAEAHDDHACGWLATLLTTLEQRFGLLATRHQRQMLSELIPVLARESAAESPERYVDLIGHLPIDSTLVQRVVRALTIKESYFFRDPSTIESLRTLVLPEVLGRARANRTLRVWSAGCSTGEEIYTVAVLLNELLPDRQGINIRLVGTDIDTDALERARTGVYGQWSLRATAPADVTRVFDRLAHGFRIKDAFRSDVTFEPYNLTDSTGVLPAPGEFDLIFCRNVSIYFAGEAIAALHRKLRSALAPEGTWIAAPSDPIPAKGWATKVLPGMLMHQRDNRPVQLQVPIVVGAPSATPAVLPVLRPSPARRAEPTAHPVSYAVTAMRREAPVVRATTPTSAAAAAATEGVKPERIARVLQYADDGHLDEALALADALIEEHPLNANVHRLSALLLEEARKIERATAAWRRVLYLAPDDVDAHLRLGLLLGRAGDRRGAVRALRNAVVARERRKMRDPSTTASSDTESADDARPAELAGQILQRMRGGTS